MCRHPGIENWRLMLVLVLVFAAGYLLSSALLIKAKAWLAPVLIEQAWQQSMAEGVVGVRPWPWADTWPVARLRLPSRGVNLLVLEGDTGNALAFGPGHSLGSAALGGPGLAVIGGHRDTHFAFLRDIEAGSALRLQLVSGEERIYRVRDIRIVDTRRQRLFATSQAQELQLVTCYPFDALSAGGPLRYVVSAHPVTVAPTAPTAPAATTQWRGPGAAQQGYAL